MFEIQDQFWNPQRRPRFGIHGIVFESCAHAWLKNSKPGSGVHVEAESVFVCFFGLSSVVESRGQFCSLAPRPGFGISGVEVESKAWCLNPGLVLECSAQTLFWNPRLVFNPGASF